MCLCLRRLRVCLRLRGRRTLNDRSNSDRESSDRESSDRDLPSVDLCRTQAAWLRGARSRLLRRAALQGRRTIVEIGAGWGLVANELCQRTGRSVLAVDRRSPPRGVELDERVQWIVGQAERLPFADRSVDLIFAQLTFLWLDASRAMREAARVLAPGGVLVAIEPDYGGLMEYPPDVATQHLWLSALRRAGADPCIGRKLPGMCAAAGLRVETRFLDRYEPAQNSRLDLLAELELLANEAKELARVRHNLETHSDIAVAHLPLWMVIGEQPTTAKGV